MKNSLMTLDGLIQRLMELREIAGSDCPIILGSSFDPRKEQMKLTMVSLDSSPMERTQYVAMLVEKPFGPIFERIGNTKMRDNYEKTYIF